MTDYSEKTDNQIDRMVGAALGVDTGLDYCNDDAAIMPIVWANKIDTSFFASMWTAYGRGGEYGQMIRHENPKRAAAICFLMMQDDKG